MANQEHLDILKQGVETWNRWRVANLDIVPDIAGADLTGPDFAKDEDSGPNFSGINLAGVEAWDVFLHNADLRGARLQNANLTDATLTATQLHGTDLTGANVSNAEFALAIFNAGTKGLEVLSKKQRGQLVPENDPEKQSAATDEHLAILKRGVLAFNFWRTDNPDVRPDLSGSDLQNFSFADADLSGADLSKSILTGSDFGGADLSDATLTGANLSGANLLNIRNLTQEQLNSAYFASDNPPINLPDSLELPLITIDRTVGVSGVSSGAPVHRTVIVRLQNHSDSVDGIANIMAAAEAILKADPPDFKGSNEAANAFEDIRDLIAELLDLARSQQTEIAELKTASDISEERLAKLETELAAACLAKEPVLVKAARRFFFVAAPAAGLATVGITSLLVARELGIDPSQLVEILNALKPTGN